MCIALCITVIPESVLMNKQTKYFTWWCTAVVIYVSCSSSRLRLPLPQNIAMELASLPDYYVSDVAEFLLFVNM